MIQFPWLIVSFCSISWSAAPILLKQLLILCIVWCMPRIKKWGLSIFPQILDSFQKSSQLFWLCQLDLYYYCLSSYWIMGIIDMTYHLSCYKYHMGKDGRSSTRQIGQGDKINHKIFHYFPPSFMILWVDSLNWCWPTSMFNCWSSYLDKIFSQFLLSPIHCYWSWNHLQLKNLWNCPKEY